MTYVGPSQVLVKPLNNESNNQSSHGVILKSQYGHEIEDVRVMGEDRSQKSKFYSLIHLLISKQLLVCVVNIIYKNYIILYYYFIFII